MPRGFLVKRIKRTGGSYRARLAERVFPLPGPQVAPSFPEDISRAPPSRTEPAAPPIREEPGEGPEDPAAAATAREWSGSLCRAAGVSPGSGARAGAEWRGDGTEGAPSRSPAKPAGTEPRRAFLERCLSSPVSAESFPGGVPALATFSGSGSAAPSAAPSSGETLPRPPRAEPALHPEPAALAAALPGLPRAAGGVKKPKAVRRLSFADEVTTSPVLGLRIKAEEPGAAARGRGCSRAPLGAFICQLCKEQYADPLALAQHRCSRIVRVEYRCPECDKVFSCPANLASHRRWHKPRPPPPAAPARPADAKTLPPTPGSGVAAFPADGKENGRAERPADQHPRPRDSSTAQAHPNGVVRPGLQLSSLPEPPRPQAPYSDGVLGRRAHGPVSVGGVGGSEIFVCPYCHKSFRRQAYLRKHLGTHEPGAPRALATGLARPPCGAPLPAADSTDPHRLWLAVRDELLLPAPATGLPSPAAAPDGAVPQTFCCKHCPSTFFSSPGLTRHINKCHPSESRQVLLLQLPLRPGC
ncbi:insulinoma-associated protein 2 [Sorex araneus]|uniref:insulinoma-associated protein 2 n=1 Tax=Sorex araneus TaxID=42254 RepID=UPI00243377A4|nr:insulinoma-associated protein 2 [Sorex araneus]